jgi:hypothetical protein
MTDRLVRLATFNTAFDAHVAKTCLEAEGLPARVAGELAGGFLSTQGSTLASVDLLVREEDLARAEEILAECEAKAAGPKGDAPHGLTLGEDPGNGPLVNGAALAEDEGETLADQVKHLTTLAFRGAIVGVILPCLFGVPNLYSLYLLLRIAGVEQKWDPRTKTKYYLALGINGLAAIWLAILLRGFLGY